MPPHPAARPRTPLTPASEDSDFHMPCLVPDARPFEDEEWKHCYRVDFYFRPSSSDGHESANTPWEAHLTIRTKDLARLMREGIHWDTNYFHIGSGSLLHASKSSDRCPLSRGLELVRRYYLSDSSHSGNDITPAWVGRLFVYARQMATLRTFRPTRDLKHDQISEAVAGNEGASPKDEDFEVYYLFNRADPDQSLNTILDETPMTGLWPWPREASRP